MIIHIINRQKLRKPDVAKLKTLASFFLDKSTKAGKKCFYELSLLLTDDESIRKIKRQYFDVDCVTDVISFSSLPHLVEGKRRTAEIVVNVERACLEGKKRKGFEHEFALYLAHGCDHLAGHDDRTVKERKKMRRRELHWLKEAAKINLLSELFVPARKSEAPRGPDSKRSGRGIFAEPCEATNAISPCGKLPAMLRTALKAEPQGLLAKKGHS